MEGANYDRLNEALNRRKVVSFVARMERSDIRGEIAPDFTHSGVPRATMTGLNPGYGSPRNYP